MSRDVHIDTEERFKRDLVSAIPLPTEDRWIPSQRSGGRIRAAAVLPAAALLVAIAFVVGVQLREVRESGRPSEAPAVAPTATHPAATTPGPTMPPATANRTLLVDLGGHGIGVRTEHDAALLFRVENRTRYAISSDGRLAYWKTGSDDALPHELHVYDARTGVDRLLLTLTNERAGAAGFLAWSVDSTGLAFAAHDTDSAFEGRSAPRTPRASSLRLLDLATGQVTTAATISGAWVVPLSWDRRTGVAIATEHGRDGPSAPTRRMYRYEESGPGVVEVTMPAPLEPGIVIDSTARWGLGFEVSTCGSTTCRILWTFTLPDLRAARHAMPSDRNLLTAAFRPGTGEIYVVVGSAGNYRVEDWGVLGGGTPRPVTSLAAPGVFHFRSDGTALLLPSFDLNERTARLVDPQTGRSEAIVQADLIVGSIGGG